MAGSICRCEMAMRSTALRDDAALPSAVRRPVSKGAQDIGEGTGKGAPGKIVKGIGKDF
jgi:hypothetical protein